MTILIIGVIRLPALLTTGLTLKEIGCPLYEISQCEPLHDLKNLITHLMNELPHQIEDGTLKNRVKEFCQETLGIWTFMDHGVN